MKTWKKTALTIGSYAAVAALAIGGTLAYMTDDERVTNVMPLGEGVDIALIEQQRGEDALEAYEQGKELLPIVGSAQGEKDGFGMPTAENYVDKIVRVENVGETYAYIRVLCAFPVAWDADEAPDMPIHWNHAVSFDPDGDGKDPMPYNWTGKPEETATIDGVEYNIYSFTYKDAIAPGYVTEPAITGFYMDSRVDFDDETGKYTMDGKAIEWDLDNFVLPVYAQAIQTDGFADAATAFKNMTTNPWAEDGLVTPTLVQTADELAEAVANGGEIVLTEDITVSEDSPISVAKDTVISLAGNTLKLLAGDNASNAKTINVFLVNEGSTLTINGGNFEVNFGANGTNYNTGNKLNTLFNVAKGGKLVINDGEFKATKDEGYNLIPTLIDNDGEVVINGGSFETNTINIFRNRNGIMTINDGTFTGVENPNGSTTYPHTVIWNQYDASSLVVNGGKFTNIEVEQEKGTVKIADGVELAIYDGAN